MYWVSKFEDRHFMACSVPPPVNANLEEDFQELTRIHFYLGRAPIDHMIEAVERASLVDIEKGKIPIYFAAKEIQDFLSSSLGDLSLMGKDKFNPSLYFDKSFKEILEHTVEVLDSVYKKPTKKDNVAKTETMIKLTQEVIFLNDSLQASGMQTADISQLVDKIKTQHQKIFDLKGHYEKLESLKSFDDYQEEGKKSVIEQLSQPYEFNYTKLTDVYMRRDDWVRTLHHILEQQKEIDSDPNYKFNPVEAQRLKDNFLKQIKSFNRLLGNGVVNYVYSFAAAISKEAFFDVEKSRVPAEVYFDNALNSHKRDLENGYSRLKEYHEEKIAELERTRDEFIQTKIDDKAFYAERLTVMHRQEKNIFQSFDKLRENLLGVKVRDTLTLEGDITKGFVVGKFSNSDKIVLIHKDKFVNVPEAVYAKIVLKDDFEKLGNVDDLVFDENLRDHGSNFWSYGQLLHELGDPSIQKFFFGNEVELMDKTVLKETARRKTKNFM